MGHDPTLRKEGKGRAAAYVQQAVAGLGRRPAYQDNDTLAQPQSEREVAPQGP